MWTSSGHISHVAREGLLDSVSISGGTQVCVSDLGSNLFTQLPTQHQLDVSQTHQAHNSFSPTPPAS